MSFEDTVNEVLQPFEVIIQNNYGSRGESGVADDWYEDLETMKAALLAAHEAEVERVIGEDDKTVDIPDFAISRLFAEAYSLGVGAGRNALRAEQRHRAGIKP